MKILRSYYSIVILLVSLLYIGCKAPIVMEATDTSKLPVNYTNNKVSSKDSINTANINWKEFFTDKYLVALIDTAVKNNYDVLTTLQEIEVANNKVKQKNGLLLPNFALGTNLGVSKVGRYTSNGAGDASADITPGQLVPENLPNIALGFETSWEADIWAKLRNAKKASFTRYLETVEGKNLVTTSLIAEVASSYYELLSLDNQLSIIEETITIQKNALEIVKIQKEAAVVTELAVKQFEAQLFNSQALAFGVQQKISESENKINFLLARYPQKIERDKLAFTSLIPKFMQVGIPSDLLKNRPDIKQAELELFATKCDVQVAKAEFYPSLNITGGMGFQAFKASYLFTTPQSLMYSLAGDLVMPIINRAGIKAEFNNANAYQVEALYNYQKAILNGYVEVVNEFSNIKNLEKTYQLKAQEVGALNSSVELSNELFKSARANYLEVLMAQKEALSAKLELVESKKNQLMANANMYKVLGGGWK
jgi:NodT family efflux transporter outer membrane factor (OMF) lipoprotein